jgi:hypothetical protein
MLKQSVNPSHLNGFLEYRKSLTINPGLYFLWAYTGGGLTVYTRGRAYTWTIFCVSIINKSVINRKINM